jgi:hypothetical protein
MESTYRVYDNRADCEVPAVLTIFISLVLNYLVQTKLQSKWSDPLKPGKVREELLNEGTGMEVASNRLRLDRYPE